MDTFTPGLALIGGTAIGIAAVLLMLTLGRIAGISGIVGGLLQPEPGDIGWRLAFIAGLIAGPVLWRVTGGFVPPVEIDASLPTMVVAGLLVGAGTQLGSGCTSGHGVCGLARLSQRSFWATLTFMAAAIATVFITRHVLQV